MRSCGGIVGAKRSSAASIAARFGMLARLLPKLTYFKSIVLVIHGRNRSRAYYIRSTYHHLVAHADAAEGLAAEIMAAGGRAIAAMADVAEAATVEMMVAR